MKLRAHLAGKDHEVSLDFNDDPGGAVSAEVDGRQYEVEIRELTGGQYLLVVGSQVYRSRVEMRGASPRSVHGAVSDWRCLPTPDSSGRVTCRTESRRQRRA